MKKIVFISLLLLSAFSAKAQFHFGGQFNINISNEHTDYSTGAFDDKEHAFIVSVKPKIYWNIKEKMQVGGRVGVAYGHLTNGVIYESGKEKQDQDLVNKAIGWSVSPFFGYRLLNWKIVSIWAEANIFAGQYYNVDERWATSSTWSNQWEYGFQILPVVNIEVTDKLALQLHLGFISLGWYGTKANYPDKVITTSTWDLHKGGFVGILQGLTDYGVGLVKRF